LKLIFGIYWKVPHYQFWLTYGYLAVILVFVKLTADWSRFR